MHLIRLPATPPTMQCGTVRRYFIAPGEAVSPGGLIVEIEHEYGLLQLEATFSGVLARILAPEGTHAVVGQPLAEFDDIPVAPASLPASPSAGATCAEDFSAVIPIRMPQAGQSMEEGTILAWRVAEGDRIAVGQVLLEIETDKSALEIEADQAGRVAKILAPLGSTVPVKTLIACLAETDAEAEAFLAAQHSPATTETRPSPANADEKETRSGVPGAAAVLPADHASGSVKASPVARKLARELQLDLQTAAPGSGPHGRILSTDVRRAAGSAPALARRPLSRMRKAIARNVQASKQTIPHFYIRQTIKAAALLDFRQAHKAETACSLNDVLVFGCARAMTEFPAFRSRLEGDEVLELPSANIGIAVGLDDGLVVPAVLGADQLSLGALARETRRLVERARAGVVEGSGQSTVTISNLGMFGIEEFAAIINPGDVAILAAGAIREGVVVEQGVLRVAPLLSLTLSCDHRLIDGVQAARFMARLQDILESLN